VSYHSTLYTNKELKQLLSGYDLSKLQLIWIKGKPARTKGTVIQKGNVLKVFGSSFIAKIRR
jgi:DNA-directed RNA polymerase subunit H (RpoH/RPB5)